MRIRGYAALCNSTSLCLSLVFEGASSPLPEHSAARSAQSSCLSPLSAVMRAVTQPAASPTSHLPIRCSSCCSHALRQHCLQSKAGIPGLLLATFQCTSAGLCIETQHRHVGNQPLLRQQLEPAAWRDCTVLHQPPSHLAFTQFICRG